MLASKSCTIGYAHVDVNAMHKISLFKCLAQYIRWAHIDLNAIDKSVFDPFSNVLRNLLSTCWCQCHGHLSFLNVLCNRLVNLQTLPLFYYYDNLYTQKQDPILWQDKRSANGVQISKLILWKNNSCMSCITFANVCTDLPATLEHNQN
jgi:hypothetical protein